MPVLELVYETHSLTTDNEDGVATGWLPGRLSAAGREQAQRLGERRRDDGLAAVFASDLARAVETAELAGRSTICCTERPSRNSSRRRSPGRRAGSTASGSNDGV